MAYTAWQYYQSTGDLEFLGDHGAEMILEIARFWSSAASYDRGRDRFVIRGVMGPDEFHTCYPGADDAGIDHNAYGRRGQFTHCIDIAPTILGVAGIPEARLVDGIEQEPMHGTSFVYTFDDADAAERHTVQYFETYGNRAIYQDGWWACARLDRSRGRYARDNGQVRARGL